MVTDSKARYLPHGAFRAELARRVDGYFARTGEQPNRARGMRLKTAIVLGWFVASYLLLTFWTSSSIVAALLSVSLGLAMAAIGFNLQHDGGHGSYSPRRGTNALMAFALDAIGGSSYVWSWKHNVFHHSNPNVEGLDADIDIRPFCRLSPEQPRRPAHRYQHLYAWFLYALLAAKWHFVDDFQNLFTGKIGEQQFPPPRGWTLVRLIAGKLLFFGWAFALPMVFHPVGSVLLCYAVASITLSLALALTFQLAHVIEGAAFPADSALTERKVEWAVHQAETSVNFAPRNRALSWFVGGLNFQIEHHLFPRVCHLHLKALSGIVEQVCREYGVPYRTHRSARAALASHARWLWQMGRPVEVA